MPWKSVLSWVWNLSRYSGLRSIGNSIKRVIRKIDLAKHILPNRNLLFLTYVWVPEVGNTGDTPNPPWVLPLGITEIKFSSTHGDFQISFKGVIPKGNLVYRQFCLLPAPKHMLKIINSYFPAATRLLTIYLYHLNINRDSLPKLPRPASVLAS